jgi:hypothetical protein
MPRRTNTFQQLILLINASLADGAMVEESAMLLDSVTDEPREVDILITAQAGAYTVKIAIEVVGRSRKADTPWVESMRAKHSNLPTNKLILVSEQGFARSAVKKAQFYGIETMTLEQANDTNWDLLASLTATGIFKLFTITYDCSAVFTAISGVQELIALPVNSVITFAHETKTLDDYVQYFMKQPEFRETIENHFAQTGQLEYWCSYTEPDGLWKLDRNGEQGQVTELRIGLHLSHSETPVEHSSGKYAESAFISGRAISNTVPLHFVLVRREDGTVKGVLLNNTGIRELSINLPV